MIRAGLVTRNGRGEAVTGLVMMLIGENGRKVVNLVKQEIESLRQSLPPGVTIETLYRPLQPDRSRAGYREGKSCRRRLPGRRRSADHAGQSAWCLIVAMAIPLSMLFAANVMLVTVCTASLMSLGAIDFGMIVDSSVIMVENCVRRLGHEGGTTLEARHHP